MSAIDDILADIPMDQLAAQLGVDEATAEQATRHGPNQDQWRRPWAAISVAKPAG